MTAMAEDAKRGITDRFRSLPISSASVALGRAIADLGSSALSLAVLMVGGLLIGWYPTTGPAEIALAVVLLLWLRFALLWLGIFLGLHFRGPGATTAVQVLVWPIGFLSTVFVSAETMPPWLGTIAEWNPVSATATAARQLFGNPTGIDERMARRECRGRGIRLAARDHRGVPAARGGGIPAPAALTRLPPLTMQPSLLLPHTTKAGSRRAPAFVACGCYFLDFSGTGRVPAARSAA